MSRKEVLYSRYGEMRDLIACYQIENGQAKPKQKAIKKKMTFDQARMLS